MAGEKAQAGAATVEPQPLSVPIEVTARPIEPKGNLMGFANVKMGGVTIKDFKIVTNNDGELFVSMPSKADAKVPNGFRNTVFVDKEIMGAFNEAVIGAYADAVQKLKDRAAVIGGEKQPPMAKQVAEAAKAAAEHNAAKPPPVKKDKSVEVGD